MSLLKETEKYLKDVVTSLEYDVEEVKLEKSSMPNLGQYQINIAMQLGKKYHTNPREVAEKIVSKLDDRFTNVNIAGPGFINVSFSDDVLMSFANSASDFNIHVDKEEPKTIVVDYGGANAAKALHVGHMRSPNIGEALKRLAKLFGNNVIGDVHLGDLGRQSGMLISELQLEQPDLPFFDENFTGEYPKINLTIEDLGRMYPAASIAAKEDEKRMEEVRRITAEIDKGHKAYTELWKQMVEISKVTIKEIYDRLNCTFELWEGELSSMEFVPALLEFLKPYMYESEGALVIDVAKEDDKVNVPPLIVIKGDGATIYQTRDLASIYDRMNKFNPDEIWYVVDQRQSLHFKQLFRACYKTGLVKESTALHHFGFGTINGPDGKPFKTRDGGVMTLESLIEIIYNEVEKKIKEEITGEERKNIAEKLAIATIKYADLTSHRATDYTFDPVKFSSIEGKTGPYMLYTVVRLKSLLNKVDNADYKIEVINNDEMKDILVKLTELSRVLKQSYNEASLNYITDYLYELSSLFNKFYNNYNILNEQDEKIKNSYLALAKLVLTTNLNLLNILAIEPVEKM